MSSFFRLVAAGYLVFLIAPANGADIRLTTRDELRYVDSADVILEGKIEIGDYDKLLKIIEISDEDCGDYGFCTNGIFLASPGGDLVEAMKIGRLVRKLRLETHVPSEVPPVPSGLLPEDRQKIEAIRKKAVADRKDFKAILKDAKANYMCVSACFFIFVAGIDREKDVWPPVLGFHRPYLSEADLKKLSGNQAIASGGQIRTVVEDFLKEMGVPAKYADLMFSVPKDQIRFVDDDEFESDFEGYIPELQDWLDAKCNIITGKHLELHSLEKTLKYGECLAQVLPKLRGDAWKQFHGQ